MRHIISFILIVCLLHTQSYHAAADALNTQQHLNEQNSTSRSRFAHHQVQPKSRDVDQSDVGVENPKAKSRITPSKLVTLLRQQIPELQERVCMLTDNPIGFIAVFFTGVVLFVSSLGLFVLGFVAWLDDIPFHVASTMFTHASLSEFQPLDVCQNFLADPKDLTRTRSSSHYEHAVGDNGVPYTEALPHWINNANNVLTMISDRILAERSSEGYYAHWSDEFELQFKKFLFVNAGNMKNNYSCSFKLGDSSDLGTITECQEDVQSDVYYSVAQVPDNADALIQFGREDKKKLIRSPKSIKVRLSVKPNHSNSQRYSRVHINSVDYTSKQRRLLQADTPLTSSEADQDF